MVTPDPNMMLRVGRLRDAKWQRPAGTVQADERPQSMSLADAIEVASALWVKEAAGAPNLKFLMFDEWSSKEASGVGRLSLLQLQDYAHEAPANSDVRAAVRLTRVEPVPQTRAIPEPVPAE
jgi:hypothetical protein